MLDGPGLIGFNEPRAEELRAMRPISHTHMVTSFFPSNARSPTPHCMMVYASDLQTGQTEGVVNRAGSARTGNFVWPENFAGLFLAEFYMSRVSGS